MWETISIIAVIASVLTYIYVSAMKGEIETHHILIISGLVSAIILSMAYDCLHSLQMIPTPRPIWFPFAVAIVVPVATLGYHHLLNYIYDRKF